MVGLAIVLVLVAFVQPWAKPTRPSAALPSAPAATGVPTNAAVTGRLVPAGPMSLLSSPGPASLADMVAGMAGDIEHWGVGDGAPVGPPLQPTLVGPAEGIATDHDWWAWVGVEPTAGRAQSSALPDPNGPIQADPLCGGLPDLPGGARVVAITAPGGARAGIEIRAWQELRRHDLPGPVEPRTDIDQVVTTASGGITLLERVDGMPWPDGRYEFSAPGPTGSASLTLCLGQP